MEMRHKSLYGLILSGCYIDRLRKKGKQPKQFLILIPFPLVFSRHCFFSIPPENIRKPKFSVGIEGDQWH